MQPETVTAAELNALGYRIEEYIEEYWQGPVYNEASYFRVFAPDGQLIAETMRDVDDAIGWARFHFKHAATPAHGDA